MGAGLEIERQVGYPAISVAGVDEVGRGCLAGPVVAAAVLLPADLAWDSNSWLAQVTDSKAVEPKLRAELAERIRAWAGAWALGQCSREEIDRHNIFHASLLAMERAVMGLKPLPGHLLVDGNALPRGLSLARTAVVKGDARCLSIACASILAKVWRDAHLHELDARYPGYGLGGHKGYPTPAHLEALRRLGVTPEHRRSFAPVARALNLTEA
ncbi:MAG: ribonuclease HII [Bdellovibrionales bacterium]|nr:ribonuclease HII [Bdellovibrionales bacterium]